MPPGLMSIRFALLLSMALCARLPAQEPAGSTAVQQSLKDGDAAFARGDYEAARQSFEKAWQGAQSLPAAAPVRYDILKRLTATNSAAGQFAEGRQYLQQAIEWRQSFSRPNDPKIVDDLLLSINLDLRTRNFDRALSTAQRVQDMHTAASTADSLAVADDFLRIGQIHLAAGKPREAAGAFLTADNLRTKLAGPLDPGLLPVLDGLNDAFGKISGGTCAGCESNYRRALAIRETVYGKDSAELIATVEGLADAYAASGEYVAAEPVYQRLLSLWEGLVGGDHPMVAVTLDKLVVLYTKEGESVKAREALARSIDIRARFLAVGLAHQAANEIAQGHADQARALYKRALAALGTPIPANADLINQIREALAGLGGPAGK